MTDILDIQNLQQWTLYLLPVVTFLLGYIISRRRTKKHKKKFRFSNDYFQGLNYLLNDQQDKALDIFIDLVETDWETIDTSLALGAIFRRKGEIDKSIKLHQNLLARPSLPAEYKSTVLIALAKDYLQAGWLDRAESLFNQVIVDEDFTEEAQSLLMGIYEQEHEWEQAINIAKRYPRRGDLQLAKVVAHYYCELSQQMILQNDIKEAETLATQALNIDKNCVRASILLGDLAIKRGRYQKAIRFLRQIEIQDIQLFPLIIDDLTTCYRNTSNLNKLYAYLNSLDSRFPEIGLTPVLTQLINEIYGTEDAVQFVSAAVIQQPSLTSLKSLIELQSDNTESLAQLVPEVVEALSVKAPAYQCGTCGYTANSHVWHCPSCHGWSSIQPKFS